MKYTYKTQGTCSSHIELEIENNIITDIAFWGGCNGNLQGLSRLVKGMSVNDVIFPSGRSTLRKAFDFLSGSVVPGAT